MLWEKFFSHIGLEKINESYENKYNQGKYKTRMKKRTKERLESHYEGRNEKLYELIGEEFDW